jgi:phospholipid transport system transporter-binding protein
MGTAVHSGAGTAGANGAGTLVADGAGRFRLSGAATVPTVTLLRATGLQALAASTGEIVIDLSAISRVDSAGLALLIDWLAWARAAGRVLRFASPPGALLALARLSDVEALLV